MRATRSAKPSLVFKALSNPVRRKIMDLLRDGPRGTSELAAMFPKLSRFAVMQHLAVLQRAGLLTPAREGRRRLNHLNPVPLRETFERWVGQYASETASAALAFRQFVESKPKEPEMSKTQQHTPQDARTIQVQIEVPISAPIERVWKGVLHEVPMWWRRDFYVAGGHTFVAEPHLGGRWYEDTGDGAGLTWFTVVAVHPEKSFSLAGHLFPEWGGPAVTLVTITLERTANDHTLLTLNDALVGAVNEKTAASLHEGWTLLFAEGLKPWIEEGKGA